MTLRVSETLAEEIRREGERAYPAECCGVLAGHPGEIKEVLQTGPGGESPGRRPAPVSDRPRGSAQDSRPSFAQVRPRGARVLSLAPRSPGGALGIRRRARLALVQLSHCAGRSRTRGRGSPVGCWPTIGRPCCRSLSTYSMRSEYACHRFDPHAAAELYRRAGHHPACRATPWARCWMGCSPPISASSGTCCRTTAGFGTSSTCT